MRKLFKRSRARSIFLVTMVASLCAVGCGDDDDSVAAARLRILVTNDDGIRAEGIDAVVEALIADPANDVIVSAPSGNRSGSGDNMGPSEACGDLSTTPSTTLSGYAGTAVNGCPADAVLYALDNLYPQDAPPQVVISGINEGQNVSELVATRVSGTVGAAKTAARNGVPALAASQGVAAEGFEPDYDSGVEAVLAWLEENRASIEAGVGMPSDVDSINVPSCSVGTIRGTLAGLPLADSTMGALNVQDCTSTLESPEDDVEAFLNGYTTQTKVPLE